MQTFQPSIYFHARFVWLQIVKQLQRGAAVTFIFKHSLITATLELAFLILFNRHRVKLSQSECSVRTRKRLQ